MKFQKQHLENIQFLTSELTEKDNVDKLKVNTGADSIPWLQVRLNNEFLSLDVTPAKTSSMQLSSLF